MAMTGIRPQDSCPCASVPATGETIVTDIKCQPLGKDDGPTGVCVPLVLAAGGSMDVQVCMRTLAQIKHDQPGSR